MTETRAPDLALILKRILTAPDPADLWQLQGELLGLGDENAHKAREAAGEFYSFLRGLESKVASRSASRWGAVLETASVSSVGVQEMIAEQDDPLKRLLAVGVTSALEVAAATKNVQAWEVEASLVYHDVAWYLYGELWDVSLDARPQLSARERQELLEQLLAPVIGPGVQDAARSAVLVRLFQVALAARIQPLLNKR
jgi:hypothetical protein